MYIVHYFVVVIIKVKYITIITHIEKKSGVYWILLNIICLVFSKSIIKNMNIFIYITEIIVVVGVEIAGCLLGLGKRGADD